ncbi:MAG TPA: helix-turn-helix domain-containing protein [Jiangellaceae bacterium]|nr:helix-turn-helix domain-containing protein [Jiangellaceae bacterium]
MIGDTVRADFAVVRPAPPLRPLVHRYVGYHFSGFSPGAHLGLPSRHLTLTISLDEPVRVAEMPDTGQAPAGFAMMVGGLASRRAVITHDGTQYGVQVELTPRGARTLLGTPAGALGPTVVDLQELLGRSAAMLPERLHERSGWPRRFALLEEVLLYRLIQDEAHSTVPAELDRAWELLMRSAGTARVTEVAAAVGWSRRHLGARFRSEYGLTPKTAAAVMRFERSRSLIQQPGGGNLADVAAACGYADQSHLTREWNRFAGCSPTAWVAGEQLPFVQDGTLTPPPD